MKIIFKGAIKLLDYKLKIGLIPDVRDLGDFATRKGIFEPAKGVEIKNKTVSYIKENFEDDQTEFYDLEWLNERRAQKASPGIRGVYGQTPRKQKCRAFVALRSVSVFRESRGFKGKAV